MRKVRVVVEIEVPDKHPMTEHDLVWKINNRLPTNMFGRRIDIGTEDTSDFRKYKVKEMSRVLEYMPGGIRYKP